MESPEREKHGGAMDEKVCLITGATSGIGKATAMGLANMGASVVMVARDRGRGEAALAEIKEGSANASVDLMLTDLSSQEDIRRLADEFKDAYPRLDVLVNNAGVIRSKRVTSADGIEMTFAVNHLAYFLLTNLLLDLPKASAPSRIVNVSSAEQRNGTIDFDDLCPSCRLRAGAFGLRPRSWYSKDALDRRGFCGERSAALNKRSGFLLRWSPQDRKAGSSIWPKERLSGSATIRVTGSSPPTRVARISSCTTTASRERASRASKRAPRSPTRRPRGVRACRRTTSPGSS